MSKTRRSRRGGFFAAKTGLPGVGSAHHVPKPAPAAAAKPLKGGKRTKRTMKRKTHKRR
jgi:hypothetical protein